MFYLAPHIRDSNNRLLSPGYLGQASGLRAHLGGLWPIAPSVTLGLNINSLLSNIVHPGNGSGTRCPTSGSIKVILIAHCSTLDNPYHGISLSQVENDLIWTTRMQQTSDKNLSQLSNMYQEKRIGALTTKPWSILLLLQNVQFLVSHIIAGKDLRGNVSCPYI